MAKPRVVTMSVGRERLEELGQWLRVNMRCSVVEARAITIFARRVALRQDYPRGFERYVALVHAMRDAPLGEDVYAFLDRVSPVPDEPGEAAVDAA